MKAYIESYIDASLEAKKGVRAELTAPIEAAGRLIAGALNAGGKVLFCGNGGSASDAQHLAAELVGRFEKDRRALAALSLATDTSILTAVGNDYAFDQIFSRQVEALGRKNDVFFGITTSGNSGNVIRALETSKALGLKTIILTGRDGGRVRGKADLDLIVRAERTCHIQECHIMIGQLICDLVEKLIVKP